MPNANYIKGVRKERKLVNLARARGNIAFRSAGSHSPIDLCIIDKEHREITFLQCKPDDFPESERNKILEELSFINGYMIVRFDVV